MKAFANGQRGSDIQCTGHDDHEETDDDDHDDGGYTPYAPAGGGVEECAPQ